MKLFSFLKENVFNAVFPKECVGCRKPGHWICKQCLASVSIHTDHICPVCKEKNTPYGQVCFHCRKDSFLDGLLVASSYRHPALSKTIHSYKYEFIRDLSEPLGEILLRSVQSSNIPLPDYICPVPLHSLRLRWRGFNQSELLSDTLSRNLLPQCDIPVTQGLIRHRFTTPQMSLDDAQKRNENIREAFKWSASSTENIQGKYVWLVDDIATTTATLNECARVLKLAGAKEVFGIVLAR